MFLFIFPLTIFASDPVCIADGHDYSVTIKEPTKDKDGEKKYVCTRCEHTFSRTLTATGHTWSEWILTKDATCTEDGTQIRYCTRHTNDEHKEYRSVSAQGHTYINKIISATCTQDGLKITTCSYCSYENKETDKKAAGHDYKNKIIKESTCGKNGEVSFSCTVCNDTYVDTIPASEHDYKEKLLKKSACEDEGEVEFACSICSDRYIQKTQSIGHDYSEWVIERESTEDDCGIRYKVCSNDSTHIVQEFIDKVQPDSSFPNTWDILFFTLSMLSLAGFRIFINRYVKIIRWEKQRELTYFDWLVKYLR